jgi:filamentous hemagglutinin
MATVKRITGDYTIKTLETGDVVVIDTTAMTVNATSLSVIGDLSVTGNASLTGNISGDKLFNGTTSIEIQTPSGNANITIGGTSNVAVFSTAGADITGYVTATGNLTGANVNTAGLITATGNVTGANLNTTGNVWITRDASVGQPTIRFTDTDTDVVDGQVFGAVEWFTSDTTGGGARVTAGIQAVAAGVAGNATVQIQTSTNGAAATTKVLVDNVGNVGIANATPLHTLAVSGTIYGSSTFTAVGNITGGNLATAGLISVAGNVTGGNVNTAGLITATGNIGGGNIISLGAISAGAAGIEATGNVTGGNLVSNGRVSSTGNINGDSIIAATSFQTVGTISATGNIVGGNVNVTSLVTTPNIVVSTSMSGGGIGVENFVYQSTDYNLTSVTPETIGVLSFDAVANQAYQFTAYITLVPAGSTTVAPAVLFSAGTCNYLTQTQLTATGAFGTATKTVSDDVATTYSSTGTDARTLMITGTFTHTANVTVSMRYQTSAATVTAKTGSYLSFTRTF